MAFCDNCGEFLKDNDKFCSSCGNAIKTSGAPISTSEKIKPSFNVPSKVTTPLGNGVSDGMKKFSALSGNEGTNQVRRDLSSYSSSPLKSGINLRKDLEKSTNGPNRAGAGVSIEFAYPEGEKSSASQRGSSSMEMSNGNVGKNLTNKFDRDISKESEDLFSYSFGLNVKTKSSPSPFDNKNNNSDGPFCRENGSSSEENNGESIPENTKSALSSENKYSSTISITKRTKNSLELPPRSGSNRGTTATTNVIEDESKKTKNADQSPSYKTDDLLSDMMTPIKRRSSPVSSSPSDNKPSNLESMPVFGAGASLKEESDNISGPFSASSDNSSSGEMPAVSSGINLEKKDQNDKSSLVGMSVAGFTAGVDVVLQDVKKSITSTPERIVDENGNVSISDGSERIGKVNDYLVLSIVMLLCCCTPMGIASLVYSIKCRNSLKDGRMEDALKHSNMAKKLNIIGFCLCVLGSIVKVLLQMLVEYLNK